jgi:succinylglutamate desuccinylase
MLQGIATPRRRVLGDYTRGQPGPLLVVTGGVHGNEPGGVEALEAVSAELERRAPPLRGRFLGLAGNLEGLASGRRYVDEDLNRVWTPERLAQARNGKAPSSRETQEQREILGAVEEALTRDWESVTLLDLHSTSGAGPPFAILADRPTNRRLVEALAVPAVFGLHRNVRGTLIDWFEEMGHASVVLEGGQNGAPETRTRHEAAIWTALCALGMLELGAAPDCAEQRELLAASTSHLPAVIDVCLRWGIEPGERFRMEPGFANLQHVHRGQLLARTGRSGEVPIRAPFDGLLLMPLYQEQGSEGFFLGLVPRAWRPF